MKCWSVMDGRTTKREGWNSDVDIIILTMLFQHFSSMNISTHLGIGKFEIPSIVFVHITYKYIRRHFKYFSWQWIWPVNKESPTMFEVEYLRFLFWSGQLKLQGVSSRVGLRLRHGHHIKFTLYLCIYKQLRVGLIKIQHS